jgi:hypothetical protein
MARKRSRARVIAARLRDDAIDGLIKEAQKEVEPRAREKSVSAVA